MRDEDSKKTPQPVRSAWSNNATKYSVRELKDWMAMGRSLRVRSRSDRRLNH